MLTFQIKHFLAYFTFIRGIQKKNCFQALAELCNILKFITQAIPNHLLARDKALVVQNLLSGITDLVNVIVSKGCYGNDVSRLKDLLTVLHSVISLWDVEWKSGE